MRFFPRTTLNIREIKGPEIPYHNPFGIEENQKARMKTYHDEYL